MPLLVAHWWELAPFAQRNPGYAVRAATDDSPAFLEQVQRAVWSVDPGLPVYRVRTLADIRAQSMARTSFTLVMLALSAGVALARLLAALLFGIGPLDPATYPVVSVVLGATALLAGYLPARRAARVDPVVALRSEV